MNATATLEMTDLSRSKSLRTDLTGDLSPSHTVGQAVETYLERMHIPDHGLRWTAFSRGVRLDSKQSLGDVATEDDRWMVLPEVSAGAA